MKRARTISVVVTAVLLLTTALPIATVGADPGPGIVGLWHFDNNADDSSGNNLHGAEQGAAGYVSGMFDMALSLDGDGDYGSTLFSVV